MKRFRQIFITVVIFLLLFSAMAYGITWSIDKRLTNNSGDSYSPSIAVDGSKIYVAWDDDTPGGDSEIYFKRSNNRGVTWTADKRITDNAGDSSLPAIAVNGSNIYVAWKDDTPGNNEIYFKMSDDGGTTWTTKKDLSNNAGGSAYPAIAVDGSNIYVVWYDYTPGDPDIYFKKSDDRGVTWTANKRITNNAGYSMYPSIAVDGSNIYVVWYGYTTGDSEIYFKKSDDGGTTWTTKKNLSNSTLSSFLPAIAVDGPNIYVVWYDITYVNYDIYFNWSDDVGVTWKEGKRLIYSEGHSMWPDIAVDGSNIYVVWVWHDSSSDHEIYFKKGNLY